MWSSRPFRHSNIWNWGLLHPHISGWCVPCGNWPSERKNAYHVSMKIIFSGVGSHSSSPCINYRLIQVLRIPPMHHTSIYESEPFQCLCESDSSALRFSEREFAIMWVQYPPDLSSLCNSATAVILITVRAQSQFELYSVHHIIYVNEFLLIFGMLSYC